MDRKEAEDYLKNGGRLVSKKRLDEVYYNSVKDEYRIQFYIGNQLSKETAPFMWEFLPTFIKR